MKFTLAVVAAFAGAASAQQACVTAAQAIPPCALGYLASAAASIGQCGLVDFACQCSNSAAVQSAIQQTVLSQCGGSAADVLNSAAALCSCASANSGTVSLDSVGSSCISSAAAIPPCALGYLASAASSIGNCGLVDFACQCSNSASVQSAIMNTVLSQCGGSAGAVLQSAAALCSCAGGSGGSSGGSSAGGSSAAATTGSGSGSTAKASSGAATSAAKATSAPAGGSGSGVSTFTGGAAVPAVGGLFGAVIGLLAIL